MKADRRRDSMYVAQNTYYAENNREVFMGPGCPAGSCKLCTEAITCRNDRLLIFWTYRTLARGEEKYKFLRDLMKVEPIQTVGQKTRKRRIRYHLPVEEALVQVCRKMFLHTMAISSRQIFRVLRQGGGGKGSKMRKLGSGKGKMAALKVISAAALGHKQAETSGGSTSSNVRRKHSKEKENGLETTEDSRRFRNVSKEDHLLNDRSDVAAVSASHSDLISPRLGVSGGAGPLLEIRPNAQGSIGDRGDGHNYDKGLTHGSKGKGIVEQERNSQAGEDKDGILNVWVSTAGRSKTKRKEAGVAGARRSKKTTSVMRKINKGPGGKGKGSNETTRGVSENGGDDRRETSTSKLMLKKNENEIECKSSNGWRVIGDTEDDKYSSGTGAQQTFDPGSKDQCLSDDGKRCDKDSQQLKDSVKWGGGKDLMGEGGGLHGNLEDEHNQDWVEDDEDEELGLRLEEDDEEEEGEL